MSASRPKPVTYLFSGYARLPHNVSHQAVYKRVGVVLEVDEDGRVVSCSSTLVTELARDFLARLLDGYSVLDDRESMQEAVRRRYRGHSQAALVSALLKVFEAVDLSPLVLGEAAHAHADVSPASGAAEDSGLD